jgi:hypothetical protein
MISQAQYTNAKNHHTWRNGGYLLTRKKRYKDAMSAFNPGTVGTDETLEVCGEGYNKKRGRGDHVTDEGYNKKVDTISNSKYLTEHIKIITVTPPKLQFPSQLRRSLSAPSMTITSWA